MNNKPQWLFDELTQVGVDYTNKDIVSDYDSQHKGFRDFDQEAKNITESIELSKDSTVLDIGCGTGGLTIPLAQTCKHIYAVDVSEAMISILTDKIQNLGLNNISTEQSGFLTYQHSGKPIDAIVANITLHHLPDFWKQVALCHFYDFLKPGGRMFLADVVFSFAPRDYQERLNGWVDGMQDFAGKQMAEETVVHIRDEFSTWDWVMSGMLERAGFHINKSIEFQPQMRSYICSKS